MWEDSAVVDMALAVDVLAEFFEEAVAAQKGNLTSFNLSKIDKWYVRKMPELLTERVRRYMRRYVEELHKMGVLGRRGRSSVLTSDSLLWAAAKAGRARVYLSNVLGVPELPPDAEREVLWKRRLKALVEMARKTGVDKVWTSKVCLILSWSADGENADVRSRVAQIVEEVEGELKGKARRWCEEGLDFAEAQSLYLRLGDAVELLAQRFDREAARRVCRAFAQIERAVENAIIAMTSPGL